MSIYGIDFTSSPSKRKPITCAVGRRPRSRTANRRNPLLDDIPGLRGVSAGTSTLDGGGRLSLGPTAAIGPCTRMATALWKTMWPWLVA